VLPVNFRENSEIGCEVSWIIRYYDSPAIFRLVNYLIKRLISEIKQMNIILTSKFLNICNRVVSSIPLF